MHFRCALIINEHSRHMGIMHVFGNCAGSTPLACPLNRWSMLLCVADTGQPYANDIVRVTYAMYMIIVTIVLLNLLIAIINDSYASIKANAEWESLRWGLQLRRQHTGATFCTWVERKHVQRLSIACFVEAYGSPSQILHACSYDMGNHIQSTLMVPIHARLQASTPAGLSSIWMGDWQACA